MSTSVPTPEQTPTAKSQRVLSCVLCQQRKIKCNRRFPCVNCTRAGVQCVPATTSQRRRRFPERELLERLRCYESLLRQNNIPFEPMHTPAADHACPGEEGRGSGSLQEAHSERPVSGKDRPSRERTTVRSKPMNLWRAMNQKGLDTDGDDDNGYGDDEDNDSGFLHDNEDVRESVIKKAWDNKYEAESNDHLLFGSPKTNVDLSTMHPPQVQIFKLWQIYLENVNPLLKVTHTPTLQGRIIDAAGKVANISPALEALMFSIYCTSILSLADDECRTLFGSPRKELLKGYQFACQQALLNCRPDTDPWSLSSLLGMAIRIAQRMGIHNESTYTRHIALEGEMRRRLWWSLAMFDNRICEMSSDPKATVLTPLWDCKTPLNVNDFDIQPEMKAPPAPHDRPTETLFAVLRSELGEFTRHSAFHLDFTNPCLKALSNSSELVAVEDTLEDKYLKFCNPENPLHFMAIWTTRIYLAKSRLLEHYSRYSSVQQTDSQRNAAISYALKILECHTNLMISPLIKGYLWFLHAHFPFPAYIHILQDLRRRPTENHAEKAWEIMSNNYMSHFVHVKHDDTHFFVVFSRIVLQAWEARASLHRQQNKPLEPPAIVSEIKNRMMHMVSGSSGNTVAGVNVDEFQMPMPIDFGHGLSYGTEGQGSAGSGLGGFFDIPRQATMDIDIGQFDWATIDWSSMHG
ncbi:hypothetical protein MW887_010866 [Aspergillus wentii]|nr:hypothetical protein MW887_010866 [Aspergillus wentii]